MSLKNRLDSLRSTTMEIQQPRAKLTSVADQGNYQDLKTGIHQKLLDRVDLTVMESMPPDKLREELRLLVDRIITEDALVMNEMERRNLIRDIQNEMLGLGPLELLLADPTISDILVNTHSQVYVERKGVLEETDIRFTDDDHLMKIIDKIVSRIGRRIDESSPMVDARLQDGSRVNAIIPPLAIDGPMLSIRRFSVQPLRLDDVILLKTLTPEMSMLIKGLAKAKINLLISGGTGSGKTTLLNILSGFVPDSERVITIEDAAELQLQQPHVVRLETRPPNIEGKGEVTQRSLVRNALRMRPDRIIIGEVRGAEAVDMLQAMNTGHEGSMTTIHANTPRDALSRLENMIGMAGLNYTPKVMRQQISSAIGVVIQVSRLTDGKRRLVSMQEITGMEGEVITMQEIFSYVQTGVNADGVVQGYFCASGIRPKLLERLQAFGANIPETIFDPTRRYE